jgi:molybdopterin converting factor subunit 1
MRVRLLLFASYAEAVGTSGITLELPPGATAADALQAIRSRAGADKLPPKPLLAVNLRYVKGEIELREGDELAIIPPVAGG